jgi:hypothetical protein
MKDQERTMSFLFVRMHFPEIFGPNAKASFYDYLVKMQDRKEDVKGYYWAFGDVGKINIDGRELIFGRLGKNAKSRLEMTYDENQHSYKKEILNVQKTTYCNFFINVDSNVIAYEDTAYISKKQFQTHFANIWLAISGTKIEFEFLLKEVEIFNEIRSWDRLTKARFKLVPTNPSSREDYEPLDEFIRQAQAERAKLEFENESKGLGISEKTPIHQGLSMASAGYGEFEVRGLTGRVGQRASSKGMEIRRDFVHIDDLESLSPSMMKEIRKIVEAMNRPNE